MIREEEPRIYVFTSYTGKRRYLSKEYTRRFGKENHTSIVSNLRIWRAYQIFKKYGGNPERFFHLVLDKELARILSDNLSFDQGGKRIAVVGFPYHRLAKERESIDFFFEVCEIFIEKLLDWYDEVVFVPPEPHYKWEETELLRQHNYKLGNLRRLFDPKELKIAH